MSTPPARDGHSVDDFPSVVFATSPNCPHCARLRPIVSSVASEYGGRVDVTEISAPSNPELARKWKVRGTPTLLAMRGDVELGRHVGEGTPTDVRQIFDAAATDTISGSRIGNRDRLLRIGGATAIAAVAIGSGMWWLLLITAALLFAGLQDLWTGRRGAVGVGVSSARELLHSDQAPTLIDIRTASERASKWIPGSIHIPLGPGFETRVRNVKTDRGALLYCASGVRSKRALKQLREDGFQEFDHLMGGLIGWESAGFPVSTGESSIRHSQSERRVP